jgi:hypothetical protein
LSTANSDLSSSSTAAISQTEDKNDYKIASDQSFGFFDDISSVQLKLNQQVVSEYEPYCNPVDPYAYWRKGNISAFYQTSYEPNFSCAFEYRIGKLGDGGKWICDLCQLKRRIEKQLGISAIESDKSASASDSSIQKCLVYSVRSNGDFSFQSSLQHKLGNETFEDWFNPSIPTMQQILVKIHHNPLTTVPFFNGLMNNGYVMFHKEPNIQFGYGRCVAYAF